VALFGFALITIAIFLRQGPFGSPYEIRAQFSSASQLRTGSEVRVAGIKVGEVSAIGRGPRGSALVTMAIDSTGRPVHADATLTIEPRLILEGNGYVALDPGTPESAELRSGASIPLSQTAVAVQLDQVLDAFDRQTRGSLTSSVASLAAGLGPPGLGGLRTSVRELDGALASLTAVARAARGTDNGDLSDAIDSTSELTAQLAGNPSAAADLVSSYADVSGVLAANGGRITAAIRSLDGLLRAAPSQLRAVDGALPELTGFATALRPALLAAPPALSSTTLLLGQLSSLVQPSALPALVRALAPVLADLPSLERRLGTLFGYSAPVTDCITTHLIPTLDMKVPDGPNSTGDPVYLDAMHVFSGLTGLSSSVDGNGGTVRLGVAGANGIIDQLLPGVGRVVGRSVDALGINPTWLGRDVNPAFRPDQPCASQPLPVLGARSGPAPEWARAGAVR
jgi:virulence factor Mce-like protein